eukprot:SAG31_NODE_18_length_35375_cov_22.525315_1_plen_63_part_00
MDAAMTEQQRQTISVAQSAAAQAADQAQAAKCDRIPAKMGCRCAVVAGIKTCHAQINFGRSG